MRKIKLFEDFFNEAEEENIDIENQPEDTDTDDKDDDIELDIELEPEDDDELEEASDPSVVTPKDTMRIKDIRRKAGENLQKLKDLGQRMANSITDQYKAERREYAAVEEHEPELAKIFRQRAIELGHYGG